MRKLHYSFVIIFLSYLSVNAQPIVNSNFENWTPSGNQPPFNWEEPTIWKTTNSLTEWTSAGVKKTNDAYNGSFACQLRTVAISGGWPSAVCNGSPELMGSAFSDPGIDIITGGEPINTKPTKLIGYYKFDNNNVLDSGYAKVILKKYNATLNKPDTIGIGDFHFGETLTYTQFEIVINDLLPAIDPDSIIIAFYSTNPDDPQAFNISATGLIIDSLSLAYAVTGIKSTTELLFDPIVYPNPVKNSLIIQNKSLHNYTIQLFNINGQELESIRKQGVTVMDVSNFASGMYYLKFVDQISGHSVMKSVIIE